MSLNCFNSRYYSNIFFFPDSNYIVLNHYLICFSNAQCCCVYSELKKIGIKYRRIIILNYLQRKDYNNQNYLQISLQIRRTILNSNVATTICQFVGILLSATQNVTQSMKPKKLPNASSSTLFIYIKYTS